MHIASQSFNLKPSSVETGGSCSCLSTLINYVITRDIARYVVDNSVSISSFVTFW